MNPRIAVAATTPSANAAFVPAFNFDGLGSGVGVGVENAVIMDVNTDWDFVVGSERNGTMVEEKSDVELELEDEEVDDNEIVDDKLDDDELDTDEVSVGG